MVRVKQVQRGGRQSLAGALDTPFGKQKSEREEATRGGWSTPRPNPNDGRRPKSTPPASCSQKSRRPAKRESGRLQSRRRAPSSVHDTTAHKQTKQAENFNKHFFKSDVGLLQNSFKRGVPTARTNPGGRGPSRVGSISGARRSTLVGSIQQRDPNRLIGSKIDPGNRSKGPWDQIEARPGGHSWATMDSQRARVFFEHTPRKNKRSASCILRFLFLLSVSILSHLWYLLWLYAVVFSPKFNQNCLATPTWSGRTAGGAERRGRRGTTASAPRRPSPPRSPRYSTPPRARRPAPI